MEVLNMTREYHDSIRHLYGERENSSTDDRTYTQHTNGTTLYPVPPGIVVLLAVLYGSISLIAVIGNGLVIFVIAKDRRMQTVTNILIANLALSDVIIGMFTTPFQFQPALHQRWDLPYFLCHIAPSFKVLSVSVSVLTLTVISIDRYVAVIYPLKAGFSKRSAVIGLILIWGIGIASSFPEGYFFLVEMVNDSLPNTLKPFCHPKWPTANFGTIYYAYLMLVQYMCPLLVIIFSYTRIACRIWGSKAPGNIVERDNIRQRNKRKVVKMLIIVVLLFVLCWMPFQVYQVISAIHPEVNQFKYINVIWFCCNWLAMSNSCYNPFIYGLLNEKFKREFRVLFGKTRCMRKRTESDRHSVTSQELASSKRVRIPLGCSGTNGCKKTGPVILTDGSHRRLIRNQSEDTTDTHV